MTRDELEAVYRRDGTRLWRAVLVYAGGDRQVADDAVAEALARALEHLCSIRDPHAWLYRVAFRQAAKELRRRSEPLPESREQATEPQDGWLVSVLSDIRPRQRAVLYLHYQCDLSVRQIAAALGISAGLVRVELHRGRRAVRRLLEVEGGGVVDWSVIAERVDQLEPVGDLWAEGVRRHESPSPGRGTRIVDQMPARRRTGAAAWLAAGCILVVALMVHVATGWPTGGATLTTVSPDVLPAKHPTALTEPPLPIGRDPFPRAYDPSVEVPSLARLLARLPYPPILPDSPLANDGTVTRAWVDRFDRAAVYYGRNRVLVILGGGGLDFTGLGDFVQRIQGRRALVFPSSTKPRHPATVRLMFGRRLVTVAGYLPTRDLVAVARTLRPVGH